MRVLVAATGRLGSASVIVRRATPADIPEIVRLKALLMETGWPWPVAVSEDEDWRRRCAEAAAVLLARDTYACFVVDVDPLAGEGGSLAGCVSVAVEQHLPGPRGRGLSAYLSDMSTDVPHRGRGIGTALLDHALAWAREQGAGRIELHSTESGRRVYERAGFEADGPFRHLGRQLV